MKWLLMLTVATGYGTLYDNDLPPARYQGDATVSVSFASTRGVNDRCAQVVGQSPPGRHWGACHLSTGIIIFPNPCLYPDQPYAKLMCHELGHANGWPADHPK